MVDTYFGHPNYVHQKSVYCLIYNNMCSFCFERNLISPNQPGFKQSDSCVNQLFSITHDICHSLDEGYETRGDFLYVSIAFDKGWHIGLLLKLEQNGINGPLLQLLKTFVASGTFILMIY